MSNWGDAMAIPDYLRDTPQFRPRRVKREWRYEWQGILITFLFEIFAVPLVLYLWRRFIFFYLVLMFGANVPARATSIWTRHGGFHGQTVLHVAAYEYSDAGAIVKGEVDITRQEFEAMALAGVPAGAPEHPAAGPTAPLAIRTFGSPSWKLGFAESNFTTGPIVSNLVPAGFITLWVLGATLGLLRSVFHPTRRRLYRNGVPASGTITAKLRRRRFAYLRYRFSGPDGRDHELTHSVTSHAYNEAKVGGSVTVLHFEGKAKPSVIYEYGGYRCV
ncbi:MAG: hypothetical protein NTW19_25335 [Planctomycetota bacterium]|nr:hypothetical protein [Planctomycetota bacterium]